MDFSNLPIKNIDQAKQLFISVACSHFHMNREYPERAKEYYALQIASSTESEWIKEEFEERMKEFPAIPPGDYGFFLRMLHDLMDRNDTYLAKLYEIVTKMQFKIPPAQIGYILSTIIGNSATKTKCGLIQKSFDLEREDLADKFYSVAKSLITMAEENKVSLPFTRRDLLDLITYYHIEEDECYLIELAQKDNIENFNYYKGCAEEGNMGCMKMLSDYYRDGKGCEPDSELALYWIKKSKRAELAN